MKILKTERKRRKRFQHVYKIELLDVLVDSECFK